MRQICASIFLTLLVANVCLCQSIDSTKWPYGGIADGPPSDSVVVIFNDLAYFPGAIFESDADFTGSVFVHGCNFEGTKFHHDAHFYRARFFNSVNFAGAKFDSAADFYGATFYGAADFYYATFDTTADFYGATLDSISFLEAKTKGYVNFENAAVKGVLDLGSHRPFMIDLTLADLTQGTVQLSYVVQLKLPENKFDKLTLFDPLGFYAKQNIIENLKEKSFSGNKSAGFELDYLLARSTMFQDKTDKYNPQRWYYVWKWPKWAFAWFYNATMGFGYRPFRIVWWGLLILVVGTAFFYLKMGRRINQYIAVSFKEEQKKASFTRFGTLLNCAYFTAMVFFTFRLKGDLLTFFDDDEKKFIITDWLLGFAMYLAFLYHTSAVLQNIKSLFVGG